VGRVHQIEHGLYEVKFPKYAILRGIGAVKTYLKRHEAVSGGSLIPCCDNPACDLCGGYGGRDAATETMIMEAS